MIRPPHPETEASTIPAHCLVDNEYLGKIPWPEGVEVISHEPANYCTRLYLTGTPHPGKELDPIFRRSEDGTTSLIDWNPK
jgi:hypothetical protein